MITRRHFLQTAAAAGALTTWTARSYASIAGANERVQFAIIGLNGRGYAHLWALKANRADARLTHVCDVDSTILDRFAAKATGAMSERFTTDKDFRRILDSKDVDAITIATPDHWHSPMAILGLQAGKHVYVEKPCSYNPNEGMMLVEAARKTGRQCQMGSQQRSSPHTIDIVNKIHSGLIGRAYWAETWYANSRKPIGTGKEIPVPPTLDWDLWQGPAPRTAYRSNVHPYNWHWFRRWGTGETLNNGTHEVDVALWALGVKWPDRVSANGGRYAAKDDWEFYDTLDVAINYPDKLLTWKGDCCTGKTTYNRDRGVAIHGTEGVVIVDRAGYEVFDLKNKMITSFTDPEYGSASTSDLVGSDRMTDRHFGNLIDAIRTGAALRQPVAQGNVAVTLMQLSNIAYFAGRQLHLDSASGAIRNDAEAERMTRRNYEKGWEPKV
ncbi:MAG TPA: Gfo/Idh/MocA family oxidoreductase [Acidobacteriaceae bacterium]|jgi:predicted dehydrogenase